MDVAQNFASDVPSSRKINKNKPSSLLSRETDKYADESEKGSLKYLYNNKEKKSTTISTDSVNSMPFGGSHNNSTDPM